MKLLVIIFSLLILQFPVPAQNTVKTSTSCNDDILFQTPGRWMKTDLNDLSDGLNQAQKKEITDRIDVIHQMMFSMYTEPKGIDAVWHPSIGNWTFAEQVRYERNNQQILVWTAVIEKPVTDFDYTCGFFRYFCNPNNSNEIYRGYPGETGTWLYVYANNLQQVAPLFFRSGDTPDTMTINGYPVHLRQPLIKKFGDLELLGFDYETANVSTEGIVRTVIIHRNGILPYIPVTRKQYLDRCIPYIKKFYDNGIKFLREAPLPYDDKDNRDIRDTQINRSIANRDFAMQRYQEELEKTTAAGMLDSPAIVTGIYDPLIIDRPIFVDEKEGLMVVIENLDYMRKDLPKYIPQLFVVKWKWSSWKMETDIAKLIEERFPFERLQAMIDK
jgi:hypothetical protein